MVDCVTTQSDGQQKSCGNAKRLEGRLSVASTRRGTFLIFAHQILLLTTLCR